MTDTTQAMPAANEPRGRALTEDVDVQSSAQTGEALAEISRRRRRMNPLLLLALMVLPIITIIALGWALVEANQGQISSGLAPNFTLATYAGDAFTLSAYQGKVVIINFWASWCAPCRAEAAELNALYDEYRNKGVVIVGVGYLDKEDAARAYLEEFGVQFPTGHDAGTQISKQYRIRGVPETYIVDKSGHIRNMFISTVSVQQLRPILDTLLAETAQSPEERP